MPNPTDQNIYSPHESSMLGFELAKRAAEHSQFGVGLDIPGTGASGAPDDPAVKDYFAPLLPWEICAVQAQTSNGKTMFVNNWERQIVAQLKKQERDEVIIHVSLEESIEAMAFQDYGRVLKVSPAKFARGEFTDWAKMQWAMTQIDGVPIWRIGDSAATPTAPELTLSNIYRSIRELVEGRITGEKWKPAVVIVDYLQALPIDLEVKKRSRDDQRRLQVASDVFRLREMTTHLKCPIIVPVQAKQDLTGANLPYQIPGIFDGLETSTIATRFDRIMSLWLPKMSAPVGSTLSNKDGSTIIRIKEDQCFMKVNKQRGGLPSGRVWEFRVDYNTGEYFDQLYKEVIHV